MQLISCKGGGNLTEHDAHKAKKKVAFVSRATSGDHGFIQLLRKGFFTGTIHSIFERTFNIECLENGELYTIASRKIDNAPNTLVTDLDRCSSLGLTAQDRVFLLNQCLHVENKLAVSTERTESWQSLLPAYSTDGGRLRTNLSAAKEYIETHGHSGGMKKAPVAGNGFEAEVARLLAERSASLLDELSKGRWESAVDDAVRLVGLGPGLTPSGDDYLTGLFTIFNLPDSPLEPYRSFCAEVVAGSSELTNPISFITMKKAADGQVRESIVRFLRSAIEGSSQETILSLAEVLGIGSSSGTDIALGLIHGLELNLEQSWR